MASLAKQPMEKENEMDSLDKKFSDRWFEDMFIVKINDTISDVIEKTVVIIIRVSDASYLGYCCWTR